MLLIVSNNLTFFILTAKFHIQSFFFVFEYYKVAFHKLYPIKSKSYMYTYSFTQM